MFYLKEFLIIISPMHPVKVFYFRLENECRAHGHIPQEVMQDVFSNISAIHKLHKDFLLPKLEERMSEW
jgi:hypothetical protein